MVRRSASTFALVAIAACGRSQGVSDDKLGGLVVEAKPPDLRVDVDLAAKDPRELGRALALPRAAAITTLGPHTTKIATTNTVAEGTQPVSDLSDQALIETGTAGAYHAVYNNSADYGRETIFVGGKLYLRPRYQRWHERAPEASGEPAELQEQYYGAIAAVWDLVAPGAELDDRGIVQVLGRAGKKIEVHLDPSPDKAPEEKLAHRKWRETRSFEVVAGEIVLDIESGVPLAAKLTGAIGFTRDGKRYAMKVGLEASVSARGAVAIEAPAQGDVVATPERLREVDDRDFLLQGIAPPLRRNPDGTAVVPQPAIPPPPQGAKQP